MCSEREFFAIPDKCGLVRENRKMTPALAGC